MEFPWEVGLVKQIKEIFDCAVLECTPYEEETQ